VSRLRTSSGCRVIRSSGVILLSERNEYKEVRTLFPEVQCRTTLQHSYERNRRSLTRFRRKITADVHFFGRSRLAETRPFRPKFAHKFFFSVTRFFIFVFSATRRSRPAPGQAPWEASGSTLTARWASCVRDAHGGGGAPRRGGEGLGGGEADPCPTNVSSPLTLRYTV